MKINWKKLILITIITFVIGNIFSVFTIAGMSAFKELDKPINIPGVVFPIVWTILYLLMSLSYYIISQSAKTDDSVKLSYWFQLIINSVWTLIFFAFKAYLFAFIWLVLLVVAIIYMEYKFYHVNKEAFYLNIPYLLWTIFAGYLNFGIYLLNR